MKKRKIIQNRVPNSSCRALVWINSSRIKLEEQKKCQKLYENLELTRKALEIHESKSVPEFQKWIHSHFGKVLTEIRDLNYRIEELSGIVDAVEEHCSLTGCPPWEAYADMMHLRKKAEEIHRQQESFEESEFDDASFEYNSQTGDSFQKAKDEFEEFRIHEEEHPRHPPTSHSAPPREIDSNTRLKDQYRNLARKLHPDLNPGLEPRQLALWHQVQEAYEARDLSRMETLAALSEMFDQSWKTVSSVSTLQSLFQELKNALKQIQKKLRLAKKDESWNFDETMQDPVKLFQLERRIQSDLHSDKTELQQVTDELQAIVDSWAAPTKKRLRNNHHTRISIRF